MTLIPTAERLAVVCHYTCFHDLDLSRLGFVHQTLTCGANVLTLCHRRDRNHKYFITVYSKTFFEFFIVKDDHSLLACHTCRYHVSFCVLHTCRDVLFVSLLKVHPPFHSWMLCVHSAIFDRFHDPKTRMYDNT